MNNNANAISIDNEGRDKTIEQQLRESEQRFNQLAELCRSYYWEIDERGMFTYISPACQSVIGYAPQELIGKVFFYDLYPEARRAAARQEALELFARAERFYNRESYIRSADGKTLCVVANGVPVLDESGKLRGYHGSDADITEHKLAEQQQRNYQALINSTLESTADAILVTNLDGQSILFNRKMTEIKDIPPEFFGKNASMLLMRYARSKLADPEEFFGAIRDMFERPEASSLDIVKLNDGRIFERYSQPHKFEHNVVGRVWSLRDITERTRTERRVAWLSFHDVLTGLYNRAYYEDELLRMDNPAMLPLSVISADVNGLKMINDVFGHEHGDELIKVAAGIVQNCCRASDIAVRTGGDEFVVLLPQCSEEVVLKIVETMAQACKNANIKGIPVSVALGTATKSAADVSISTIINHAETNMYRNKMKVDQKVRGEALEALARIVHEKDCEAEAHSERMRRLVESFARYLNLPEDIIADAKLAATLHDIGKITVSAQTLQKSGKLTSAEWEEIKSHPATGYRVLRATRCMSNAVEEAVLTHHERWDGKGYPQGLIGESIPYLGRLIALVDAFDIMTHDRTYRAALTHDAALAELRRCCGAQFDPQLTEAFLKFLDE